MNTTAQHTPGAIRAAEAITGDNYHKPSEATYRTDLGRKSVIGIADLIDYETHAPELLAACKRALPWIGRMIADGGHVNSVLPNDCVGAMRDLDAAIAKATA